MSFFCNKVQERAFDTFKYSFFTEQLRVAASERYYPQLNDVSQLYFFFNNFFCMLRTINQVYISYPLEEIFSCRLKYAARLSIYAVGNR